MRIKTFVAPTMREALALARNELGEDAVVLNTKHMKSGRLPGLRGGSKVELMAAIDDAPPQPAKPDLAELAVPAAASGVDAENGPAPSTGNFVAKLYAGTANAGADSATELWQLRSEVRQLGDTVQGLLSARQDVVAPGDSLLLRLGVDEDIARGPLSGLLAVEDPSEMASALAGKLQAFALPPALASRQVIVLVGPTGVGKTTTLAKLAARFSLEQRRKVALVTADTYRIGAVEQLRTYSRIMGVPLEVALSPEEVAAGIEKHGDKDVVLVDTVGRSQRSDEHLCELKTFVDAASPTETHLVVAASLAKQTQREAIEKFALLSPTRLVITKLDESPDRGCLANLPLHTGLAISCLTAGQNVPQDIEFADAGRIARLISGVD